MKKPAIFSEWEKRLIIFLLLSSVVIYVIKFIFFGDNGESNTLSYIFNSLGFLPINVLIVTLIVNRLLTMRAKKEQQEKLRMVLGVFFSELGGSMLKLFVSCDPASNDLKSVLDVNKSWTKSDFSNAEKTLETFCMCASPLREDLLKMRTLLTDHHDFLLRLLENPLLLEQNAIAKFLQDIFHLSEELSSRDDLLSLPDSDVTHLAGDVNRVYGEIVSIWLSHMEYLHEHYPYLLSLSLRKSPFTDGDVVVRE